MSAEAPSALRRCPRCETEKHRSEFTTQGMCRPCSRAYDRERYHASKGSNPPPPRAAKPAPPPSPPPAADAKPTTISDVADRVAQWKAPRETPLPGGVPLAEVMATMVADPVMAPHLAEARKPPDLRRESSGVAKLCAQLVDVIDDGETITITASRFGTVIVLRGVVVERPL